MGIIEPKLSWMQQVRVIKFALEKRLVADVGDGNVIALAHLSSRSDNDAEKIIDYH
jgi:hypothetical protein